MLDVLDSAFDHHSEGANPHAHHIPLCRGCQVCQVGRSTDAVIRHALTRLTRVSLQRAADWRRGNCPSSPRGASGTGAVGPSAATIGDHDDRAALRISSGAVGACRPASAFSIKLGDRTPNLERRTQGRQDATIRPVIGDQPGRGTGSSVRPPGKHSQRVALEGLPRLRTLPKLTEPGNETVHPLRRLHALLESVHACGLALGCEGRDSTHGIRGEDHHRLVARH